MDEIRRVETKKDWDLFVGLPWDIYSGDPHWVPPLRIQVLETLDVRKNPYFQHARMLPLMFMRDGKCVGRVVGAVDDNHNKTHDEKIVFFGFFEAIDDPLVTKRLLEEVSVWGKSLGMDTLRGPVSLSTNHECGLLVEGFNESPYLMMTYNPKYYLSHMDALGLVKVKDLFAYEVKNTNRFSEKMFTHA